MAVRHGYGKIAGTDALVFAYDTGDTRNSYRGEPTTNLISGVANPTLSTSGWYSTGWNGNISIDTDEGALVLNATNGWRSMSYDFGVTNGTVTVQFDYKLKSAEHTNIYMVVLNGTHLGSYTQVLTDELSTGTIYPSLAEYKTFRKTFNTTTDSKICIVLRGTDNAGLTDEMFIKNLQVEQKSHATPFVNGTRSATQGLLDLTGNNTIDLSNASFNSNAEIEFDGTDSYIQTNFGDNISSQFTAEFIFYATTNATHFPMQMYVSADANTVFRVERFSAGANSIEFGHSDNGGSVGAHELISFNFPNNTWHHCTLVYDGSYKYIYKNGTLDTSTADSTITWYSGATLRIGARQNSSLLPLAGYMPVVKIYNRALTADEIRNNYRLYKTRFNIS